MDVRLDGKVALITGADSGIGQGMALEFARSGADVAVHYYSDLAGAEETAAQVRAAGQRALVLQADVGDYAAVGRMFDQFDAEFGHIDIMVNNAARVAAAPPPKCPRRLRPGDEDQPVRAVLLHPAGGAADAGTKPGRAG